MATSKTQIANLALSRLGAETVLNMDTDTNNASARACRLHYTECLKKLLRMAPWGFAIRRQQLARSTTAPAFGWAYQYPLPVDCVQVLECNDLEPGPAEDFAIEDGHVLSNSATAKVRYVYLAEDPAAYPPDFTEALVLLLASSLAVQVTGDANLAAGLKAEFEAIEKPRASRQNGNERRDPRRHPSIDSDLVAARWGGGGA